MTVPQLVLDQLLPRKDNQIGCQEMLAVALLMETFWADSRGRWFWLSSIMTGSSVQFSLVVVGIRTSMQW